MTWLLAAASARCRSSSSGDPQLDRPVDALLRGDVRLHDDGRDASSPTSTRSTSSLLMWRQFTQWLGGMGIIVLALAVLPRLRVGGRQLLESELPGPEIDQLARADPLDRAAALAALRRSDGGDRRRSDARRLVGARRADGRRSTPSRTRSRRCRPAASRPDNRSLEPLRADHPVDRSLVFMVLAGANFALTYRAFVRRRPGCVPRTRSSASTSAHRGRVACSSRRALDGGSRTRARPRSAHGVFQAVSIMTTTGFASADFALWPTLAADDAGRSDVRRRLGRLDRAARSRSSATCCSARSLRRELRQTVHPELVIPIRLNGDVVDERTLRAVTSFILLYVGLFVVGAAVHRGRHGDPGAATLARSMRSRPPRPRSATSAPGSAFAGPMGSFEPFSDVSTVVMTILMWVGRLEVIPIVVLLTRRYWRV